jgi:hypothetical protein
MISLTVILEKDLRVMMRRREAARARFVCMEISSCFNCFTSLDHYNGIRRFCKEQTAHLPDKCGEMWEDATKSAF